MGLLSKIITAPLMALGNKMNRNAREEKKQAKLVREVRFQEKRVTTRALAGKLARTKAKADAPIRTGKKPRTRSK